MASSINASTSAGLVSTADLSGVLQLQSNGTTIATISSTGLQTNVGAPAFSAYQSLAQTLSSATYTKLQFQTKEFDTNSNFDAVTNYRFTPTVAGYYQVNGQFSVGSSATSMSPAIYKNGSIYKSGNNSTSNQNTATVSCIVYLNGSTDYIEFYGYLASGQALNATASATYFQAAMIRSA